MKKLMALLLVLMMVLPLGGIAFAEEITINFPCIWVGTDAKSEGIAAIVDAFNTDYAGQYKVVIEEYTDYQAYRDKVRTLITTGQAPDIFSFDNAAELTTYSSSGRLMDLSTALNDEWVATLSDGCLNYVQQADGAVYALPYEQAIIPMFYNTRLFAEAGVESFPETMDEMWEACEKLKAIGVSPFSQMTGENAWTSMLWYSMIVNACGGKDAYANGLDNPAFEQAAEILKQMFEYTTADAVGAGAAVSGGHFLNERSAMFANGPWYINNFYTNGVENLDQSVAVSPFPSVEGGLGETGSCLSVVQAFIAAGKQDDPAKAEAVVAFLKYMTNPELVSSLSSSSACLFFVKFEADENAERIRGEIVSMGNAAPYTLNHFQGAMPTAIANAFPSAVDALVLDLVDAAGFVQMLKDAE